MAQSGSFKPCPVNTQTTVFPAAIIPSAPSFARELPVGVQDLAVGNGADRAFGIARGFLRLFPRGRIPDADRGRDRRRLLDRMADDDRRRTGRLEAEHAGQERDVVRVALFAVALPVRRDVPGVPYRHHVVVGRASQRPADLERAGLLPFDPVRVHRVHERDRVVLDEVARDDERFIEVRVDLDQLRAVHERLRELAQRDLPLGDEHGALDPGFRRVRGRARARVPRRRADHGLRAFLHRFRDRDRHPAVLEGSRRVRPFVLEIHVCTHALGQALGVDQRRAALTERDDRRRLRHGQAVAVLSDDPAPEVRAVGAHVSPPSTRITLVIFVTSGRSRSTPSVACRSRSSARCVIITSCA